LVLRDKTTISTPYLASVRTIEVKPGEAVDKDAVIFNLQSMEVLERLADLSSRNAGLAATTAEFNIRLETIAKLLPLARRREKETAKVLQKFDELSGVHLVTATRHDDALRARFEAQRSLVRFQAEFRVLRKEIEVLRSARSDAMAALEDLRSHYADGVAKAPVQGSVGAAVPSVGDVFKPGETILSIYSGEPYILVYLPQRYIFPIKPGMKVKATSGRMSAKGVIAEILPITDALPKEFQSNLKPRDRSQLARIRFDKNPPFPLHAKVEVRSATLPF
jgi:multidrug resistance efflux pump